MEAALQNSIDDSLSSLQQRLERQHEDEAKGKDMRIAIRYHQRTDRRPHRGTETATRGLEAAGR